MTLVGRRGRTFGAGTAFYIAPGPVHRFRAESRAVIAGFAPVTEPIDDSPETLSARGVEILTTLEPPPPRPTAMRIVGRRSHTAAGGEVETESAVMGGWLFTRSTFGRQSGYAQSWCDLAHWGLVLDGSLVLHWEDGELELLGPGDAFHCPAGPVGHRIEVADGATIVDYTPVSQLDDPTVRRAARALKAYAAAASARGGDPARRASARSRSRTAPPPPDAARVASRLQGRTQPHATACNRSPPMLTVGAIAP